VLEGVFCGQRPFPCKIALYLTDAVRQSDLEDDILFVLTRLDLNFDGDGFPYDGIGRG
jgi:hypothetical protein